MATKASCGGCGKRADRAPARLRHRNPDLGTSDWAPCCVECLRKLGTGRRRGMDVERISYEPCAHAETITPPNEIVRCVACGEESSLPLRGVA